MEKSEVEVLFTQLKWKYIKGKEASNEPIAYILGGQPSSGKSGLVKQAKNETPNVLPINGDKYREHHPHHKELLSKPLSYSTETQIFSNVFTEGLIAEAIKHRLSVSVEGTMRRSEVVANTARNFKQAGFKVELMCISAPPEFTAINLFSRYASEVELTGSGRLADFDSHNQACTGLLKTLDDAYQNKDIDRIRLYAIFGTELIADYNRGKSGQWNIQEKPSELVLKSRDTQFKNRDLVLVMLDKGLTALSIIKEEDIRHKLISQIQNLIRVMSFGYQSKDLSLATYEDKLLDEIDRLTYSVGAFKKYGIDNLWRDCKLYNSSSLFEKERASTGEITISQALKMALDNTPIKTSKVTLDTIQIGDTTQLRVNGNTIDELLNQDNSRTVGRKR